MRILCISGYRAWDKVSQRKMPSHHLYGIHEMVDHYVEHNGTIRGIIKKEILGGGYIDFYLWNGGKKNVVKQSIELLRLRNQYDVYYDMLNRCSIILGALKKIGMLKTKLITVMHHPPYNRQLKVSLSDAYIFFDREYRNIAVRCNKKLKKRFYVNEWKPDREWYQLCVGDISKNNKNGCFIDNGKSRRDRNCLIEAAEKTKTRVDFAGECDGNEGWARPYKVDLDDDVAQARKLVNYKGIVIPVQEDNKEKIGPLGITSYLDAIALGIPVVVSDNVCFANEVMEKGVGLVYKTGNSESLAECFLAMKKDSCYNMIINNIKKAYYQDVTSYSERLRNILEKIGMKS